MAFNPQITFRCQVLLSVSMGLVLLVLTGCRGASNAQVDVMEKELRQQEDYIYELEDYLVEYSEKLRRARRTNCQQASKIKSSTKPAESEKPLEKNDLLDDSLLDKDLTLPTENVPKSTTSVLPKTETENSPEPGPPQPARQPTETRPPATPKNPEDLEIPKLKIEEPSAAHPNRPSLPWSINDTKIVASSAEEIATRLGPLKIPDPVNYQPPKAPRRQDLVEINFDPIAEDAGDSEPLETEFSAADRVLAAEETTPIDRIVIQQLLQTPSTVDRQSADAPHESSTSSSSLQSTPLPGSLLAVVEIRDMANEPVDAEGELSLMVMAVTPSQANAFPLHGGKPRRLQRWDFSAEELRQSWQSSPLGDGLHLELPLKLPPLSNEPLELWARLVTVDGKKYLTKLPFNLRHLQALQDALPASAADEGLARNGPGDDHGLQSAGESVRLADGTIQESASWPLAGKGKTADGAQPTSDSPQSTHNHDQAFHAPGQWRTAQVRPKQPGVLSNHPGTGSRGASGTPHWVAQTGARHSRTALTGHHQATAIPRLAARQLPANNKPVWKSSRLR